MKSLIEMVEAFFISRHLKYDLVEERTALRTGVAGRNGYFDALAVVDEESRGITFVSLCPLRVPASRRQVAAELIARINWPVRLGHFDLGMDDGEIRYRTAIMLGKTDPDEETIAHLILANFTMMNHYFSAITAVLFGNVSPEAALEALTEEERSREAETKPGQSGGPNGSVNHGFGGRLGQRFIN
jgi:hypothetical protein